MKFKAIFVILIVLQGQSSAFEKFSDELIQKQLKKMNEEIRSQSEEIRSQNKEIRSQREEINALKEKVQKLENVDENGKNDDNEKDVEERLIHLEELSKVHKARTCQELSTYDIQTSGRYTLDPDGDLVGLHPITVYCDFEHNVTEILHDSEFTIKIEKCSDGPGCFRYDLTYFAPMPQIQAIMDLSESCTQSIDFGCFLAPLEFEGSQLGWWSDKYGNPNYYFNGDHSSDASDHTCACGKILKNIPKLLKVR